MLNEDFESENSSELDEILYSMNSEDFLENEVEEQLGDGIFSDKKTNYVKKYIGKYKYFKNEYSENQEFIESLSEKKDDVRDFILDKISDKFEITVDDESKKMRVARALYEFFVVDYKGNLETLILNYINNNKKDIVTEIKRNKKGKDISSTAGKMKYSNNNDAILINNINMVIFDIMPCNLDENFLDLIIGTDDSVSNITIRDLIDNNDITIDNDTMTAFIEPLIDKDDGYSDVVSNVVIELNNNAKLVDLDIFNEE
jgi:hypothetical protein